MPGFESNGVQTHSFDLKNRYDMNLAKWKEVLSAIYDLNLIYKDVLACQFGVFNSISNI